jgi:hypothetical protein
MILRSHVRHGNDAGYKQLRGIATRLGVLSQNDFIGRSLADITEHEHISYSGHVNHAIPALIGNAGIT